MSPDPPEKRVCEECPFYYICWPQQKKLLTARLVHKNRDYPDFECPMEKQMKLAWEKYWREVNKQAAASD